MIGSGRVFGKGGLGQCAFAEWAFNRSADIPTSRSPNQPSPDWLSTDPVIACRGRGARVRRRVDDVRAGAGAAARHGLCADRALATRCVARDMSGGGGCAGLGQTEPSARPAPPSLKLALPLQTSRCPARSHARRRHAHARAAAAGGEHHGRDRLRGPRDPV